MTQINNMKQIEKNIINSFGIAKDDILRTQNDQIRLGKIQERLFDIVKELENKELELNSRVRKVENYDKYLRSLIDKIEIKFENKFEDINERIHTEENKKFVGAKTSGKIHEMNCPFAQNIKPVNKIIFESKEEALDYGFDKCKCVL